MKLWALILAAGTILAVAAPAADAASPSAGNGGSARITNTIRADGLHTTTVFRDPLNGNDASVRPLERPRSAATLRLVSSGKLADLLEKVIVPRPHFWPFLAGGSTSAWLSWALFGI
jgi:hypothetical protein